MRADRIGAAGEREAPVNAYRRGVRIELTISPQVSAMLDRLLAIGLFGRNRAHVAQGLLYRALRSDEVRVFAERGVPRRRRR